MGYVSQSSSSTANYMFTPILEFPKLIPNQIYYMRGVNLKRICLPCSSHNPFYWWIFFVGLFTFLVFVFWFNVVPTQNPSRSEFWLSNNFFFFFFCNEESLIIIFVVVSNTFQNIYSDLLAFTLHFPVITFNIY